MGGLVAASTPLEALPPKFVGWYTRSNGRGYTEPGSFQDLSYRRKEDAVDYPNGLNLA